MRRGEAQRTMPLEALYLDYKKQSREAGEWVEAIVVPHRPTAGVFQVASYKNSKRNEQDISAVCAAIAVTTERGVVTQCRIAFGGMAGTPKRAALAEHVLTDKAWSETTVRAAMEALGTDYSPMTDMRSSAAYRMQVAQNHLLRFWLESQGETDAVRVF